jgi:hypothetical protein
MVRREAQHHDDAGFLAKDAVDTLTPGTYYLVAKDDSGRRTYQQVPWA